MAPSRKCTPVISLSTRDLTATLAIGVTVPSASMRTGTTFLVAVTISTGTARGAFCRGACAPAAPGHKPLGVAARAQPAAPRPPPAPATNIRFFITAPRGPTVGPAGLPLCSGAPLIRFFLVRGDNLLTYPYERPS